MAVAKQDRAQKRGESWTYQTAVEMLATIVEIGMLENDVETTDEVSRSFLHGVGAALGLLLDPPPDDFEGMIDMLHMTSVGYDYIEKRHARHS